MDYKTATAAHTTMLAHVWTHVPVLTSLMMNITVSVHLASLATTALKVRIIGCSIMQGGGDAGFFLSQ